MRVEARGGLVEQQDVRLREQRRGEREAPAGPYEHAPILRSGDRLQTGGLQRFVGVPRLARGGGEDELVAGGAARVEAVAVQHAAHAAGRVRAASVALARPSRMRSVVVFPAPLGPRNPHTLPSGTANDSPSTAAVRP